MATNAYVDAPQATPPRYGIVAAAPTIDDARTLWINGVTFNPEACAPGSLSGVDCATDFPDWSTGGATNPATVIQDAFVVWAADQCSTLGSVSRDFEGRARRALLASESYMIAQEFQLGALALDGRRLSDNTAETITAAAVAPGVALGMLEWSLGRCQRGKRGMIHCTIQVLDALVQAYAIENAGGVWLTPMGNIVVADAGYTGATPAGADATTSQWMYATGMVYLRLGSVEAAAAQTVDQVDRSVNTRRFVAWRPVLIEWDECCLKAAQVNVAVPAGLNL